MTNNILSIFSSILGQTLAAATREEQNSKNLINLINSTLLKHEKLSSDKRNGFLLDFLRNWSFSVKMAV